MDITNADNRSSAVIENALLLSKHGLTQFPLNTFYQCRAVKFCYLAENALSELPDLMFSAMPSLQWLDLRGNNIEKLPTNGLTDHQSLETLLLQNNRIRILPHQLGFVPNLRGLQVAGNPIENIPFEVIASGFPKLINYLRKLHNEQKTLLPVSETFISNHCQKEGVPDRTIVTRPANLLRRHKKGPSVNDEKDDVGAVLNVKSYAAVEATSKLQPNQPVGPASKRKGVKACVKVTTACRSFGSRCKTAISKTNILVTQEKIHATAEKLRQRARLRETVLRQSQILQRLKDVETRNNWKINSSKTSNPDLLENYKTFPSKNFREITPFDLDSDMMKMLSRKDIYISLKDWEEIKHREAQKILAKFPEGNKIRGIEHQIDLLSEQLSRLDCDIEQDLKDVKKNKMTLSSRIQQINKLRRTLQNLHGKTF